MPKCTSLYNDSNPCVLNIDHKYKWLFHCDRDGFEWDDSGCRTASTSPWWKGTNCGAKNADGTMCRNLIYVLGLCEMHNMTVVEVKPSSGRKDDQQKLRYDLMPLLAEEEIVKVLTKGAEKYAPENWRKVENGKRRYYSAFRRHVKDWLRGELNDPEMGTHHLANAICNLLFILDLELDGKPPTFDEDK